MAPITAPMHRPRLYRAQVRFQVLLGLVAAVVLVVVRPPVGWAFFAGGLLGLSWGVLTYVRLRQPRSGDHQPGDRPSGRFSQVREEEHSHSHAEIA